LDKTAMMTTATTRKILTRALSQRSIALKNLKKYF